MCIRFTLFCQLHHIRAVRADNSVFTGVLNEWHFHLKARISAHSESAWLGTFSDQLRGESSDHHAVIRTQRKGRNVQLDARRLTSLLEQFAQALVGRNSPSEQHRCGTHVLRSPHGLDGQHVAHCFLE